MSKKVPPPAVICPECKKLDAGSDAPWPNPHCKVCGGVGAIGDLTRCSEEVSVCFGGAINWPWGCQCDNGLNQRHGRWEQARNERANLYRRQELLERLLTTERMLWSVCQEETVISALRLALQTVEDATPYIEDRMSKSKMSGHRHRLEGARKALSHIRYRLQQALNEMLRPQTVVQFDPDHIHDPEAPPEDPAEFVHTPFSYKEVAKGEQLGLFG